jgi:hypothetical protein
MLLGNQAIEMKMTTFSLKIVGKATMEKPRPPLLGRWRHKKKTSMSALMIIIIIWLNSLIYVGSMLPKPITMFVAMSRSHKLIILS